MIGDRTRVEGREQGERGFGAENLDLARIPVDEPGRATPTSEEISADTAH